MHGSKSAPVAAQPVNHGGRQHGSSVTVRPFPVSWGSANRNLLLPSVDSDIRVAFDQVLELAGVRPNILAEVDDMAMLRLLAHECGGVTLVPPIVLRDGLESGVLVEDVRLRDVPESFYAIVLQRRFSNPLLKELLTASGR